MGRTQCSITKTPDAKATLGGENSLYKNWLVTQELKQIRSTA